jgi:hypothetical protein
LLLGASEGINPSELGGRKLYKHKIPRDFGQRVLIEFKMWPINAVKNYIEVRRAEARRVLSGLEERLRKENTTIEIRRDFGDEYNIDYLAFGVFSFDFLEKYSCVDKPFCRFVKKYGRREKDPELEIELLSEEELPKKRIRRFVEVGRMPNPNYEREREHFLKDEQKRGEILATEEGRVYTYVLHEEDGSQDTGCSACNSTGGSYSSIGLADPICSCCDGKGKCEHTPSVTHEQRTVYNRISKQLSKLRGAPDKTLWVYARIK